MPPDEPTITDRGFMRFDPIAVDHGGEVKVYESSSAEGCKVWLSVNDVLDGCGNEATIQMDEDAALALVRQVVYLLDHHHNADDALPAAAPDTEGRGRTDG